MKMKKTIGKRMGRVVSVQKKKKQTLIFGKLIISNIWIWIIKLFPISIKCMPEASVQYITEMSGLIAFLFLHFFFYFLMASKLNLSSSSLFK